MNTLTTWNPFRELDEVQDRFTTFFGGFPTRLFGNGKRFKITDWSPQVDILEEERSFGSFERAFNLPEDADAKKIAAEFRDGVLKVHLPKVLAAKPKPVEVKVT